MPISDTVNKLSAQELGYIAAIVSLTAINGLAISMYSPALPQIAIDLHASTSFARLTLTVFVIGLGASQLIYGPLSDAWGRKPILIFGTAIAGLGALLCVLGGERSVILGRLLQGLGGGAISVCARALVRDNFSAEKLVNGVAFLVIGSAVIPMAAPALGGTIQQLSGWRAIFFFQFLYTIGVCLALTVMLPKATSSATSGIRLADALSTFLEILSNRIFQRSIICISAAFACQILYLSISPFVIQTGLGISPSTYGYLIVTPVVMEIAGNYAARRLSIYFDSSDAIKLGGLVILLSGLVSLAMSFLYVSAVLLIALIAVCMFGAGLLFANATAESIRPFKTAAGSAAALAGFLQQVGAGLVSVASEVINSPSVKGLALGFIVCGIIVVCSQSLKNR